MGTLRKLADTWRSAQDAEVRLGPRRPRGSGCRRQAQLCNANCISLMKVIVIEQRISLQCCQTIGSSEK